MLSVWLSVMTFFRLKCNYFIGSCLSSRNQTYCHTIVIDELFIFFNLLSYSRPLINLIFLLYFPLSVFRCCCFFKRKKKKSGRGKWPGTDVTVKANGGGGCAKRDSAHPDLTLLGASHDTLRPNHLVSWTRKANLISLYKKKIIIIICMIF